MGMSRNGQAGVEASGGEGNGGDRSGRRGEVFIGRLVVEENGEAGQERRKEER